MPRKQPAPPARPAAYDLPSAAFLEANPPEPDDADLLTALYARLCRHTRGGALVLGTPDGRMHRVVRAQIAPGVVSFTTIPTNADLDGTSVRFRTYAALLEAVIQGNAR